MKSTSNLSRLVRMAARSPARSIAGPEVILKLTPSSFAIISARQVLPRPGGPESITWSRGSFLFFAESIKIFRFSTIFPCPIKSEIYFGRRLLSNSLSSFLYFGVIKLKSSSRLLLCVNSSPSSDLSELLLLSCLMVYTSFSASFRISSVLIFFKSSIFIFPMTLSISLTL